jgi:UDP-glucose 4-epimerase
MILVTGASGFIGKHLLKALIEEYGKEHILALTSTRISECPYLLHYNYSFDEEYFLRAGFNSIDTIIHLGAFIPKSNNQANDRKECNSNIINTSVLLAAKIPTLKKFIFISSVDIYGKSSLISETTPQEPVSLYGASKLYCEKMVLNWAEVSNRTHQILRIGHTYGPGEEAYQKIIPNTMRNLLHQKTVQLWGSGEEIRAFIYIDDVVKAILNAVKLEESVGVVNLVSAQQVSIKKLIEKIITISNCQSQIENIPLAINGRNLIFDNSKMKSLLLRVETRLEEGLQREWDYMKQIN